MCQIINCYNPAPSERVPNGVCSTGGTGIQGIKNNFLTILNISTHQILKVMVH